MESISQMEYQGMLLIFPSHFAVSSITFFYLTRSLDSFFFVLIQAIQEDVLGLQSRSDGSRSVNMLVSRRARIFDNYVIPLARKLKECNVFGVSSDEYLNYAGMVFNFALLFCGGNIPSLILTLLSSFLLWKRTIGVNGHRKEKL
jgi:hypothetical protein